MDKGKEKCEILKAIRAYVAEKYGLDYTPSECNHRGKCRGTCPKCDAELENIQRQLEKKGITDITNDTKLSKMVEDYLLTPTNDEEDGDMLVCVPDIPVTHMQQKACQSHWRVMLSSKKGSFPTNRLRVKCAPTL